MASETVALSLPVTHQHRLNTLNWHGLIRLTYAYSLTGRLSLEGRRKPTKALRQVGESASRRAAHHVLVRKGRRASSALSQSQHSAVGPALTCRRVGLVGVDHAIIDVTGALQRQHVLVRVVAVDGAVSRVDCAL